jgi:hypothetical protein
MKHMNAVVQQLRLERERVHSPASAHRPSTGGARQRFQRCITHGISSRSAKDQLGAESAMGKSQGARAEAEENNVCVGQKEDRGGSTVKVGEGQEGGVTGRQSRGGVRSAALVADRGALIAVMLPVLTLTLAVGWH